MKSYLLLQMFFLQQIFHFLIFLNSNDFMGYFPFQCFFKKYYLLYVSQLFFKMLVTCQKPSSSICCIHSGHRCSWLSQTSYLVWFLPVFNLLLRLPVPLSIHTFSCLTCPQYGLVMVTFSFLVMYPKSFSCLFKILCIHCHVRRWIDC